MFGCTDLLAEPSILRTRAGRYRQRTRTPRLAGRRPKNYGYALDLGLHLRHRPARDRPGQRCRRANFYRKVGRPVDYFPGGHCGCPTSGSASTCRSSALRRLGSADFPDGCSERLIAGVESTRQPGSARESAWTTAYVPCTGVLVLCWSCLVPCLLLGTITSTARVRPRGALRHCEQKPAG